MFLARRCCASLGFLWITLVAGAALAEPPVRYSEAAGALLLEFSEQPGSLPETVVTLRVYGDGAYVVERPPGMQRAGTHAGRLPPGAVRGLVNRLVARGTLDFDDSRSARRTRHLPGGGLARETSDPSLVTLRLYVDRRAAGPIAPKHVRVLGLRRFAGAADDDATFGAEDAPFVALAASCAELRALIDAAGGGGAR